MTERRLSRAQVRRAAAIAAAAHPVIALLGRTYRWRVDGYAHYQALRDAGVPPIFAFWHGRILPATCFWRDRGIVVMTSENFDGEWIARIIQRFGYGVARGSTSRGAQRALVQLRRDLGAGKPAAFTLDGPRGPARIAQPGAVWLAGATGSPVLPFHIEAARAWSAVSWDRTQVPQPFSRVAVAIGAPRHVPPRASDAQLAEECRSLERVLGELNRRTRVLLHA